MAASGRPLTLSESCNCPVLANTYLLGVRRACAAAAASVSVLPCRGSGNLAPWEHVAPAPGCGWCFVYALSHSVEAHRPIVVRAACCSDIRCT